ncbi:hypothetical protein [Actinoplanes missouriensis]|nr:hypothetical protein [Actinoplanes missouriensis]KOX45251.1 hypothetical protein ADL19_23275 [Streptomyces purpurogeneiscleroticus]
MAANEITSWIHRPDVLVAGLLVSVLLLVWLGRRIRQVARSARPDEPLSNLAMIVGLGWSSEAVWELTGRAGFPTSLRLLMFFVLETLLVLAMIRAKRSMREHGHPGRSGRTAWIVATAMAVVAAAISSSLAEGILRLLIPLLVTLAWWDGLVGEAAKRADGASSWRWTPRRFLLWLGAIEPGERDIETVHRERLTQQLTRLEFHRRHGTRWQRRRATGRLARLSLAADDDMIADVRRRVDRSTWFAAPASAADDTVPRRATSIAQAGRARIARARHGRRIRTVRLTHLRPRVPAAQQPRQDERAAHEIDFVIRALRTADPTLGRRRLAALAGTSEAAVRRAIQPTKEPEREPRINGERPELQEVGA